MTTLTIYENNIYQNEKKGIINFYKKHQTKVQKIIFIPILSNIEKEIEL